MAQNQAQTQKPKTLPPALSATLNETYHGLIVKRSRGLYPQHQELIDYIAEAFKFGTVINQNALFRIWWEVARRVEWTPRRSGRGYSFEEASALNFTDSSGNLLLMHPQNEKYYATSYEKIEKTHPNVESLFHAWLKRALGTLILGGFALPIPTEILRTSTLKKVK